MLKRIKKRFDITVNFPERTFTSTFELDKNVSAIHGLLVTSDKDDLLYYRGSQRIEINREEIFPEKYESKLLMSGLGVAPDERFYSLGKLEPGNYKVKVDFTDTSHITVDFEIYRVSLYLDCEITEI
ncbi:MAG: hypothetical protein JNK08_09665 [Sediminibacterium sp.]|nr:hypothetical protein [Sediminibacterium sp.]